MGKRIPLGIAISAAVITAAVTVSLTYVYAMDKFNSKVADINERQAMYTKLSEIDRKARQDYVGTINEKELTDGICAGYLAGLGDSQGKYLSAEKYKEYLNTASSKNIGVGIKTVRDSDGNMEVTEVMPNSPAEKAGIKNGDTVVSMDGKEIVRMTYGEALNKLDGTKGTKVKLGILRESEGTGSSSSQTETKKMDITVTRAEYVNNTLESSMINGNAAYIKISEFKDGTSDEFTSALSGLIKKGAVGIVIDLRSNSGGDVKAAADVLDTLLPAGDTVRYKNKNGKITTEYTSASNEIDLPVSVVTDSSTFGAAEIFASDIKEFKKGLLVGEKTAGYGTKDEAVPLSDGSAVVLSVANYITVSGNIFTGSGISVDVTKALSNSQKNMLERNKLKVTDDPQVQAAVSALIRQGANIKNVPGSDSTD